LGREKLDKSKIRELLLNNFGEAGTGSQAPAKGPIDRKKMDRIRRGLDEILTLLDKDDRN
ncbi:MAG TPA: hypothetical protein VLQ89_09615, partial [Candidatus Binatia bacterium]|nr:hypothetical protein [Candidatus Binatia bacterium]